MRSCEHAGFQSQNKGNHSACIHYVRVLRPQAVTKEACLLACPNKAIYTLARMLTGSTFLAG